MINPLGFTLENFDAIGRYREVDRKTPIDSTGSYLTQTGEVEKFKGEKDLAAFLADSKESQDRIRQTAIPTHREAAGSRIRPERLHDLQKSFAKERLQYPEVVNRDRSRKCNAKAAQALARRP